MRSFAACPGFCGLQKHRFRQVELAGNRLHRLVAQAVAVKDNGERISLQPVDR
jgi:hypothetical protein